MTDIKKLNPGNAIQDGKFKIATKNGSKSVQDRLLEKAVEEFRPKVFIKDTDPFSILVDCSGSMSGVSSKSDFTPKIDYLRTAVDELAKAIEFNRTPVDIIAFPGGCRHALHSDLEARNYADDLCASGGTPLGKYMEGVSVMTKRVLIISDGEPDNEYQCLNEAKNMASRKVVCDCIHIGDSKGGEALLKQIAEITKGLYIKFTNVQAFSQSIAYLAPRKRNILESKSKEEIKGLLGASEVSK